MASQHLSGQKLIIEKFKWDILGDFQTMCQLKRLKTENESKIVF